MASGRVGVGGRAVSLKQVVAQHLHAHWVSQGARAWLNPPKVNPARWGARAQRELAVVRFERGCGLDGGGSAGGAERDGDRRVGLGPGDGGVERCDGVRVSAGEPAAGIAHRGRLLDGRGPSYTDLVGLRNPNPDQQWSGDPTVVSIDGGAHFVVGSLFLPSLDACADGKPAQLTVAVEVLTPTATGVAMGKPVVTSKAGNACTLFQKESAAEHRLPGQGLPVLGSVHPDPGDVVHALLRLGQPQRPGRDRRRTRPRTGQRGPAHEQRLSHDAGVAGGAERGERGRLCGGGTRRRHLRGVGAKRRHQPVLRRPAHLRARRLGARPTRTRRSSAGRTTRS